MPKDAYQGDFTLGEVVTVPCVVTGYTEGSRPTVTLSTKLDGFDGLKDTLGPIDAIQVVRKN